MLSLIHYVMLSLIYYNIFVLINILYIVFISQSHIRESNDSIAVTSIAADI